jgi:hypothetical protein
MDTYYPINYDKSIKKQRLVYDLNLTVIWSYIVCYFNAIVLFAIISVLLGWLFSSNSIGTTYFSVIVLFLAIVLLLFLATNFILLNKTVKIDGIEKEANKNDMITVLSQYFELNNLDTNQKDIIRDVRRSRPMKLGRVVTCLFDDNLVFLNITRLERYNTFSPLSCLFNYYKCKRIAKKFQELQSASPYK